MIHNDKDLLALLEELLDLLQGNVPHDGGVEDPETIPQLFSHIPHTKGTEVVGRAIREMYFVEKIVLKIKDALEAEYKYRKKTNRRN